jgi:hypothetical protein
MPPPAIVRRIHLFRARKLAEAGAETLYFHTQAVSRRRLANFFSPDSVPEFDGEDAWFEAEQRGRLWRIVRRIHPDGRPFDGAADA